MQENGSVGGTKVLDKGIECGSKVLYSKTASVKKVRYKRLVCGLKVQDISSDNGTKVLDKRT